MNHLKELSKIADRLDELGYVKEADSITQVMVRLSQQQTNVEMDIKHWKEIFHNKYNAFVVLIEEAKSPQNLKPANPNDIESLYQDLMSIASNYLQNDADVFQAMKWVMTAYQGYFK